MSHTAKTGVKVLTSACCLAFAVLVAPGANAQSNGDVVDVSELTILPALTSAQQAATLIEESYPDRLQRRGIGGSVVLELVIDEEGKVDRSSVEVVTASIGALGDAAKSIIHRIRFTPGEVNGQPVKTRIQFPIEYRVEGQ